MLRTTAGTQYHGTLTPPRIAPSRPIRERTEVSLYPTSPSWRSAAPHGCLVSLLIALSGWRSWRQKTSRFEKRGKIRSTELFSFQGASEAALSLFTIQRTFFISFWGSLQKIFLLFSAHPFLPQRQSLHQCHAPCCNRSYSCRQASKRDKLQAGVHSGANGTPAP